jgi:hypothetical protein
MPGIAASTSETWLLGSPMKHPPTTFVHDLASRLRCPGGQCDSLRGLFNIP